MEEVKIRRMKDTDFTQVHKLIEQVHFLHLNAREDIYKNEDPLSYGNFIEYLKNFQYLCYVAEINNVVVGEIFAVIKEIKEENIFKHRLIIYIEDICVDNKYRRRGIGKLLYKKIIEIAKEKK